MGLSFVEVKEIKEAFQQEFWKPPMNMCGVSWVGRFEPDAPDQNDRCISVGFSRELQDGDPPFPHEYRGVKVFFSVIGEIRAL